MGKKQKLFGLQRSLSQNGFHDARDGHKCGLFGWFFGSGKNDYYKSFCRRKEGLGCSATTSNLIGQALTYTRYYEQGLKVILFLINLPNLIRFKKYSLGL